MSRALIPFAILLSVGCTPPEPETTFTLPTHEVTPTEIEGIDRLEGEGPFVAGSTERFRALVDGLGLDYQWSASGGELVANGDEVSWTLPLADNATLSLRVEGDGVDSEASWSFLVRAVSPNAVGQVDDSGDTTGSYCDLAIDGATDTPHIVYYNTTHDSVMYATFNGVAWDTDLVDGPGYGVGYTAEGGMAIAVDSGGDVHIAYMLDNGEAWYASRSGSSWNRELIGDNVSYTSYIGLDFHPSGNVMVAYSQGSSVLTMARRTSANNWTLSTLSSNYYLSGGPVFDSTGRGYVTYGYYDTYVAEWTNGGGWIDSGAVVSGDVDGYHSAPMAIDASNEPVFIDNDTVCGYDSGWWCTSYDRSGSYVNKDIAWDSEPHIAVHRDNALEFLSTDADDRFEYTWVATSIDSSEIAADVDSSGNLHACYKDEGTLWFE